jgi:hypothetical protein
MEQLRAFLAEAAGDKAKKVYIQAPSGEQMVYPCLLIRRDTGNTAFADNRPYRHTKRYLVTGIVQDSDDSSLYDILKELPKSRHDRSYTADELVHDVFTIDFDDNTEVEEA